MEGFCLHLLTCEVSSTDTLLVDRVFSRIKTGDDSTEQKRGKVQLGRRKASKVILCNQGDCRRVGDEAVGPLKEAQRHGLLAPT